MSKNFPLQSLLDLSQTRMDDAAKRLAALLANEQEGARRLELLKEYRAEYERRFVAAAQAGLSPREWQNYQGFLGRLDEAVAQQQAQLEASRNRTQEGQKQWVEERNKVRAFDALADRHQAGLARREAKTEQRASDEHAAKPRDPD
jgi:flagellar FliJ protein